MADTVSDLLFERLRDWGVHRIFGYPGDGINGILGAGAFIRQTIKKQLEKVKV